MPKAIPTQVIIARSSGIKGQSDTVYNIMNAVI